jgi:hypothetical protein
MLENRRKKKRYKNKICPRSIISVYAEETKKTQTQHTPTNPIGSDDDEACLRISHDMAAAKNKGESRNSNTPQPALPLMI